MLCYVMLCYAFIEKPHGFSLDGKFENFKGCALPKSVIIQTDLHLFLKHLLDFWCYDYFLLKFLIVEQTWRPNKKPTINKTRHRVTKTNQSDEAFLSRIIVSLMN